MDRHRNPYRKLTWTVLALSLVVLVGGTVFESTRTGEELNLLWFWVGAAALSFTAFVLTFRLYEIDRKSRRENR